MTEELTIDTVKHMAEGIGLTRLSEEHLEQLLRATNAASKQLAALPVANLTPADEPGHVYRPTAGVER